MRRLVFISHRSADPECAPDPGTRESRRHALEVRDALARRLQGEGFGVWLDRSEIGGGDPIRQSIHQGLATCDAAVILVSDEALMSDWVKYEASWLEIVRSGVPVLPVCLPGVSDRDLKTAGPLLEHLADLHHVAENAGGIDALLTEIVEALRHLLPEDPTRYEGAEQVWKRRIESRLAPLGGTPDALHGRPADDDPLVQLWRGFGLGDPRRLDHAGLISRLAGHLVRATLTWDEVCLLRDATAHLPVADRASLADELTPLWVNPDHARELRNARPSDDGRTIVRLDIGFKRLSRNYLQRATFWSQLPAARIVSSWEIYGEDGLEHAARRAGNSFSRLSGFPPRRKNGRVESWLERQAALADRQIREGVGTISAQDGPETIRRLIERDGPFYFVVRLTDERDLGSCRRLLETVLTMFPGTTGVLLAGRAPMTELHCGRLDFALRLSLTDDEEAEANRLYVGIQRNMAGRMVNVDVDDG